MVKKDISIMKRIIFILIAALSIASCSREQKNSIAISLSSDESIRKELNDAVKEVNDACPVAVDQKTTMVGAEYSGNTWCYKYELKEDSLINFQNMVFVKPLINGMKDAMKQKLSLYDNMNAMMEALIKANSSLKYQYTGDVSGFTFDYVFTPDEMKQIMDSKDN